MPTTQELIEKYKSEMQKMISRSNIQPQRETTPPQSFQLPSTQSQQQPSQSQQQPSQSQQQPQQPLPFQASRPSAEIPAPQITNQFQRASEPEPVAVQPPNTFPEFVNSGDELKKRIEEILSQNSDVAMEGDMPADSIAPMEPLQPPLPYSPQLSETQTNNTQTNNTQTNDTQTNDTQIDDTSENSVSRTCIRGGQKANFSPPANTGSITGNQGTSAAPLTDTAKLTIDVFTANRAIPIKNAVVRIKNPDDRSVLAVLTTDENGATSQIDLAAPSAQLSQNPQSLNPFVNYFADIRADGFVPQSDIQIQLFGGENTRLPANLIPSEAI